MALLDEAPDGLLAQRAADGDARAFSTLVRRHAPFLIAFATRLTGSRADADDCVQEAFITAWDRLPTLADPEKVRAWLTTIVSRKATDRIRARKPVDQIDDLPVEATTPTPESAAISTSRMDALKVALSGMSEELRTVWLLKEVGGHSHEEIAAHVGQPVSTVRGRLARARSVLLERMEGWR